MEIILPAAYSFLFCCIIRYGHFFRLAGIKPYVVILLFLSKIAAGVILSFIYSYYYNPDYGDTINYFRDAIVLFDSLKTDPGAFFQLMTGININSPGAEAIAVKMNLWSRNAYDLLPNDYRFMIRINALIVFFSFKNYFVHIVVMNFISFTGLTAIYRYFSTYSNTHPLLLTIAVYLLPSVLFWNSGILKETVLMFAMGILLYGLFPLKKTLPISRWTAIAAGFFLLLVNKPVVSVLFIPFVFFLLWVEKTGYQRVFQKYLLSMVIFTIVFFSFGYVTPGYHPAKLISHKRNDLIGLAQERGAGSLISAEKLKPSWIEIAKKIPNSFFIVMFRPHLLEIKNILYLPSALENLLILFVCFLPLFYYSKPDPARLSIVLAFTSFSLALFIAIGLTTPVLGASVRYKMPALPFLIGSILMLTDTHRIISIVKKFYRKSSHE